MLSKLDPKSLPAVSGSPRIGACVAGTGKFICIGLNYPTTPAETVPPFRRSRLSHEGKLSHRRA